MEFKSYQESRSITRTAEYAGILINYVYSSTRNSLASEVSAPTFVRVTAQAAIGEGLTLSIDRTYNQEGEYNTDANSAENSLLDLSELNAAIKETVLKITQPEE